MKLVWFLLFTLVLVSCKKGEIQPYAKPYELDEPSHFPKMAIPLDNLLTEQGVELGRRLFYDKRLSGDNSMSCAACHSPQSSFSDGNQFSIGIDGLAGTRQSMALVNLGYQKFFFWDGRAKSLEEQILEPVPNPIEMHQSWKDAINKLKTDDSYRKEFHAAFGADDMDEYQVVKAIAQFLRTMISGSSKYDVIYKNSNGLNLSPKEQVLFSTVTNEEKAGYDLFLSLNGGDCVHCHSGPLMQLNIFANNGLDATFSDKGKGGVTGKPQDMGMFKVPTLRNIAQSAPYMHDGRFQTLDEVIEHYSSGIVMSPTISPSIEFASQGGVQLDAFEKGLIKKFLLTLTDEEFLENPKFAPPN
jgi:cytochrome c peroxidase